MAEEEKKVKERRPQAQKRDIQSERRRLHNRARRSKTTTAIRTLSEALTAGKGAESKQQLSAIFSIVDKGVKTGLYKQNKADRIKSRLSKKLATAK
jgi:small subunit ribosomal protein S20